MRLIKRYNQNGRDLLIDIKCEKCGHIKTGLPAYDDKNYWEEALPNIRCDECKKSSNDLGSKKEPIETKYPEGFQV